MPQARNPASKRWYSQKYTSGYCFERHGRVWVRIADFAESAGLRWNEANKKAALEYLDAFLEKFYQGHLQKDIEAVLVPQTLYALLKEFADTRLTRDAVKPLPLGMGI